jgi:hypothetical protein
MNVIIGVDPQKASLGDVPICRNAPERALGARLAMNFVAANTPRLLTATKFDERPLSTGNRAQDSGLMFWLKRKMLCGSYLRLTSTRPV